MLSEKELAEIRAAAPTVAFGDDGLTVITTVCRLSFVNFEKPHTPKGSNKDPRYSCAILLPAGVDHSALVKAAEIAWTKSGIRGAPKHMPWKRQADMAAKKYEGFDCGEYFFNAETKKPLDGYMFGLDKAPVPPAKFYSGCYARVKVWAQAYDQAGNQGVKFWLQGVQFVGDGKKLGGDASSGFGEFSPPARVSGMTGGAAVAPNAGAAFGGMGGGAPAAAPAAAPNAGAAFGMGASAFGGM